MTYRSCGRHAAESLPCRCDAAPCRPMPPREPPRACPPPSCCPPETGMGYLMQRVVAVGRVWEQTDWRVPPEQLPCGVSFPLMIREAHICGCCTARRASCGETVLCLPVRVCLTDGCRRCFEATDTLQYTVSMWPCSFSAAAVLTCTAGVRPGRPCRCGGDGLHLEVQACVYATLPGVLCPSPSPCPPPSLPWYPQPCLTRRDCP